MKRKLLLSAMVALFLCSILKAYNSEDDSTKVFDSGNKRIIVIENAEKQRLDVEVYERQDDDELLPYEKIFEGHYRDGQSREQRKYLMSIDIPSPLIHAKQDNGSWTVHLNLNNTRTHYRGLGFGFAGFADQGDLDQIPFKAGSSPEINWNFFSKSAYQSRNKHWNIVTGLGMRWVRYHLKGNNYFQENNGITEIITAGNDWRIKKSRIGITTLNVPLLLEWKTRNNGFFLSAGGVCSFKTASSSKIWYVDERNKNRKEKMDRGMTLRPVTFDVLMQAGRRDFGLYARYSPVSIFEQNKGPELYPLTFGVMLYFD